MVTLRSSGQTTNQTATAAAAAPPTLSSTLQEGEHALVEREFQINPFLTADEKKTKAEILGINPHGFKKWYDEYSSRRGNDFTKAIQCRKREIKRLPKDQQDAAKAAFLGALENGSFRGGPAQSAMRLKESPYSSTPPPAATQSVRLPATSPHDLAQPSERDYYARQPSQAQYIIQQQQQQPASASPQLTPSYQPQSQQPPFHRQLALGQRDSHAQGVLGLAMGGAASGLAGPVALSSNPNNITARKRRISRENALVSPSPTTFKLEFTEPYNANTTTWYHMCKNQQ